MTPVYQTIFTPPHGNCLQACVASLLNLRLEDVPNFMLTPGPDWYDGFVSYMLQHNLYPIYIDADAVTEDGRSPIGYHLIQGKSPRGQHDHVVVAHEGDIVHDPHPDGGDLEDQRYVIVFAKVL